MKNVLPASCILLFVVVIWEPARAADASIEDAQTGEDVQIEDVQIFDAGGIEDSATAADATDDEDAGPDDLGQTPDAEILADAQIADTQNDDAEATDAPAADSLRTDSTDNDLERVDVGRFDVPRDDADPGDTAPCVPGCVNDSTLNSCSATGALVVLRCPDNSLCQVDRCVMQAEADATASSCSGLNSHNTPGLLLSLSAAFAMLWRRRRRVAT